MPLGVTTLTTPVVAPAGTLVWIAVPVELTVNLAGVPLKVTRVARVRFAGWRIHGGFCHVCGLRAPPELPRGGEEMFSHQPGLRPPLLKEEGRRFPGARTLPKD